MAEEAVQVLTFESEEARQEALKAIPDVPDSSVTDIDAWNEDLDRKVAEIEKAEIKPKTESKEPAPEEPKAVQTQLETEPPAVVPEDDELVEIRVKRSELPDELKSYKDGKQILKQFANARANINRVDEQRREAQEALENYKAQVGRVTELEEELKKLKAAPQTPTEKKQIKTVESKVSDLRRILEGISQDDIDVNGEHTYKALKLAVDELDRTNTVLSSYEQRFDELRAEVNSAKSEVSNFHKTAKQLQDEQRAKQEQETLQKEMTTLSSKYDTLKTNVSFDRIENNISTFCDKLSGSQIRDWGARNRVINAIIQNSPELDQACKDSGIMLGDVGLTQKDVMAYSLMVKAIKRMNGFDIDPNTGKDVPRYNLFGKQVSYPNLESAFTDILRESGITDKEHQKKLIEAERRGQQTISNAISSRDRDAVFLEEDGAASPDEIGTELPEAMAREIIGQIPGTNTINVEKMETLLRLGQPKGWQLFDVYNKALKRLGLPEEAPEDYWPKRPNA